VGEANSSKLHDYWPEVTDSTLASQQTFASARTDVACVLQNMEQHNLRDEQKIRKPAVLGSEGCSIGQTGTSHNQTRSCR